MAAVQDAKRLPRKDSATVSIATVSTCKETFSETCTISVTFCHGRLSKVSRTRDFEPVVMPAVQSECTTASQTFTDKFTSCDDDYRPGSKTDTCTTECDGDYSTI